MPLRWSSQTDAVLTCGQRFRAHSYTPLRAAFLCLGALFLAALFTAPVADADTFTVEPFDLDGVVAWWNPTITQLQLGGSECPCEKVQYPSTGLPWDNQTGADNIWKLVQNGTIKSGDTILGFSLGVQVISLFMSQHQLPAGVRLVLCGDTFARNQQLVDAGQGVPWDTLNQVMFIANEYDGWSDGPDKTSAPGYWMAMLNAAIGSQQVHNYVSSQPGAAANVVQTRGNITAILIPNQHLPLGDEADRPEIDGAYSRPAPSPQQQAAATDEQVPAPMEISQAPEPIAGVG